MDIGTGLLVVAGEQPYTYTGIVPARRQLQTLLRVGDSVINFYSKYAKHIAK